MILMLKPVALGQSPDIEARRSQSSIRSASLTARSLPPGATAFKPDNPGIKIPSLFAIVCPGEIKNKNGAPMPLYEHVTDHSTFEGANRLARRLESHWIVRGYPLMSATIFQVKCPPQYHPKEKSARIIFGVKSNIGTNGYPPTNTAIAAT